MYKLVYRVRPWLKSKPFLLPALVVTGAISLTVVAYAASSSVTILASSGSLAGSAQQVPDATAASGSAVQFTTPSNPGGPGCGFTAAAFCEDFTGGPKSGGRAGQLDPTKWSVTRFINDDNGSAGQMLFPDTPVSACKSGVTSFSPSNDIMICDSASGHANQALVAINAQNYAALSMRPRQPFDFAGRTGTITFDADATSEGGLAWWPAVFITDQPESIVTNASQVMGLLPKNGIGINFDGCSGSPAGAVSNAVGSSYTYNNYVETSLGNSNQNCFTTQRGVLNHVQIKLSQTSLEVWVSDKSTDGGQTFPNFRKLYSAAINLNFSRGYVHFMTAERAPSKYFHVGGFGIDQEYANMYWTKLGFDGPVINTGEVGYMLPDALTAGTNGKNIAYKLPNDPTPNTFTISNVNLTGVAAAKLTFATHNTYGTSLQVDNIKLHYSINGGTMHSPNPEPNYVAVQTCGGCPGPSGGGGVPYSFPVALSELRTGTNTITLQIDNAPGTGGWVSALTGLELLTFTGNAP